MKRRGRRQACLILLAVLASSMPAAAVCFVYAILTTVPVEQFPFGVAVNANTNLLYVTHPISDSLSILDATTGNQVAAIPMTRGSGVSVNPVTDRAYVASGAARAVFVVQGIDDVTTIPIASPATTVVQPIAVNPVTNRVYVVAIGVGACCPSPDSVLYAIDGVTNTVIASRTVGQFSLDVAVNPTTNRVYVANSRGETISVIDGDSLAVLDTVAISSPVSLDVNSVTNRIYVAHVLPGPNPQVSVLDGLTHEILASMPAPASSGTGALTVDSQRNLIYLTATLSDTVSVFDGSTNSLVASIPVGLNSGPVGVAVHETSGRFYVTEHYAGTVSIGGVVSADDSAQLLIDYVNSLVGSGELTLGQANALTATLEQVKRRLQDGDTSSAISLLANAFSHKVEASVKSQHLTSASGQTLLTQAALLSAQAARCTAA